MIRNSIFCNAIRLTAVVGLLGSPDAQAQTFTASPAPEWSALFDRTEGWTGADGIYSIPLSGVDDIDSATPRTKTAWIFGDTFIGSVNPQTDERLPGTTLVNNTVAQLTGPTPDATQLRFYWGRDAQRNPRAVFLPETPTAQPGDWYWVKDGFAVNGISRLFAYRFTRDNSQPIGYRRSGVCLIKVPAGSRPPFPDQVQTDTPLFVPATETTSDLVFGGGVLVNTVAAGVPDPDGYVYVYGTREDAFNKKLVVARVFWTNADNVNLYRVWNGSGWVTDIAAAAPIGDRVSNEMSVTPIGNGKYLLVFQLDAIGRNIAVRIADSPIGPFFGAPTAVYECPEPAAIPGTYVYNAKAHPHLSAVDEILVSYNVNTTRGFSEHFANADIYRPRFIKIHVTW